MTKVTDAAPIPTLPPLTMPIEEAMRTQRALRASNPIRSMMPWCCA